MRLSVKIILKYLIYYPVMVFCCLEIAFRILGYQHYKNEDYSVQARPVNAFVGDPTLGIRLQPGEYQITINDALSFHARHLENHTRYVSDCEVPDHPDILFLGCSFTYGFGVNDDQHFTSLLQQQHQTWSFQNAGVIGYGTVQSLLQLQERVDTQRLKAVVLNLSSLHFMRNTLSPQYRSNLKIGYARSSQAVESQMEQARFPYRASCAEPIQYASWKDIYSNWPGREWLASINWFQTLYDTSRENRDAQVENTLCLIREMDAICQAHHISFGIACLDSSPGTNWLKSKAGSISWVDVGFDFSDETLTNYPYDSHPNPAGHQLIAERIEPLLIQLLDEK